MRSHDVLWGRSPRLGTARRRQIQQATEAANRRVPSLAFLGLCLVGLVIILAIGVVRLFIFGPWWTPAHGHTSASQSQAPRHVAGRAQTTSASSNRVSHPAH